MAEWNFGKPVQWDDYKYFLTASKHCGNGLKNDFVVGGAADELLSFKNKLTNL